MEFTSHDFVRLHVTSWEHAHELAMVLRRAGFDVEYDAPRPGTMHGVVGFAPCALYVASTRVHEARELLSLWQSHSERRIDALAREMWRGLVPSRPTLLAVAVAIVVAATLMLSRSVVP